MKVAGAVTHWMLPLNKSVNPTEQSRNLTWSTDRFIRQYGNTSNTLGRRWRTRPVAQVFTKGARDAVLRRGGDDQQAQTGSRARPSGADSELEHQVEWESRGHGGHQPCVLAASGYPAVRRRQLIWRPLLARSQPCATLRHRWDPSQGPGRHRRRGCRRRRRGIQQRVDEQPCHVAARQQWAGPWWVVRTDDPGNPVLLWFGLVLLRKFCTRIFALHLSTLLVWALSLPPPSISQTCKCYGAWLTDLLESHFFNGNWLTLH